MPSNILIDMIKNLQLIFTVIIKLTKETKVTGFVCKITGNTEKYDKFKGLG